MYESVQPIMFMSFLDWDFIIYLAKKIWAIFYRLNFAEFRWTDRRQTNNACREIPVFALCLSNDVDYLLFCFQIFFYMLM